MTTIISGDGITTPALTNEGNTTLGDASTDTLNVGNGGLIKDASGNVGVGVTPSAWNTTNGTKALQVGTGVSLSQYGTSASSLYLASNYYHDNTTARYIASGYAARYAQVDGVHYWGIAPSGTAGNAISFTTAMMLDASGNLLVGTTTAFSNTGQLMVKALGSNVGQVIEVSDSGTYGQIYFRNPNGLVGSITTSGSATAYNTSSDYRLKDNVADLTGSAQFIASLRPRSWSWKADGSTGVGFIAHELQEVSPSSVVGTKDAVDADGNPEYQAVEYGSAEVIAHLVNFVKELKAENDALKARLDAAGL